MNDTSNCLFGLVLFCVGLIEQSEINGRVKVKICKRKFKDESYLVILIFNEFCKPYCRCKRCKKKLIIAFKIK